MTKTPDPRALGLLEALKSGIEAQIRQAEKIGQLLTDDASIEDVAFLIGSFTNAKRHVTDVYRRVDAALSDQATQKDRLIEQLTESLKPYVGNDGFPKCPVVGCHLAGSHTHIIEDWKDTSDSAKCAEVGEGKSNDAS